LKKIGSEFNVTTTAAQPHLEPWRVAPEVLLESLPVAVGHGSQQLVVGRFASHIR
jgi:hypothetical protein